MGRKQKMIQWVQKMLRVQNEQRVQRVKKDLNEPKMKRVQKGQMKREVLTQKVKEKMIVVMRLKQRVKMKKKRKSPNILQVVKRKTVMKNRYHHNLYLKKEHMYIYRFLLSD